MSQGWPVFGIIFAFFVYYLGIITDKMPKKCKNNVYNANNIRKICYYYTIMLELCRYNVYNTFFLRLEVLTILVSKKKVKFKCYTYYSEYFFQKSNCLTF